MTNKQLWLKGCEENNTLLYPLENNNNIYLYSLKNKYEYKHNYYYTNPVYMIWKGDKCIWNSQNLFDTYQYYNKICKKEEEHK